MTIVVLVQRKYRRFASRYEHNAKGRNPILKTVRPYTKITHMYVCMYYPSIVWLTKRFTIVLHAFYNTSAYSVRRNNACFTTDLYRCACPHTDCPSPCTPLGLVWFWTGHLQEYITPFFFFTTMEIRRRGFYGFGRRVARGGRGGALRTLRKKLRLFIINICEHFYGNYTDFSCYKIQTKIHINF